MRKNLRRLLAAALLMLPLVVFVLSMPGCNTMKGVGRDISGASEDVEDSLFGDTKSHTGRTSKR